MKNVDILFGNEEEVKSLFNVKKVEDTFEYILKNVEIGVITLRERGSYIISRKEGITLLKTTVIDKVVDSTGAGDTFAAAFLYGYINNLSLKDAGILGNKIAGKIIQIVGAKPTIEGVKNYIRPVFDNTNQTNK